MIEVYAPTLKRSAGLTYLIARHTFVTLEPVALHFAVRRDDAGVAVRPYLMVLFVPIEFGTAEVDAIFGVYVHMSV